MFELFFCLNNQPGKSPDVLVIGTFVAMIIVEVLEPIIVICDKLCMFNTIFQ